MFKNTAICFKAAKKDRKNVHRKWLIYQPTALFLLLWITGCSVLSKGQLKSIQVYAVATQEYARFPGLLIKDYVAVQNNIFLLSSPLTADPNRAAERIFSHHSGITDIRNEAENLDISFSLLKEYAKNLEMLSAPDYFEQVTSNLKSTGTNLDLLIDNYNKKFDKALPGGLGNLVYQSMAAVGQRYLDRKRGDILKEYLTKGEPLIQEISEISKRFLKEKVGNEWIMDLDLELKSAHAAVRRQILVDTLNYPSNTFYIISLDTQVAKIYDDISQLKKLNEDLITSIDELYLAHHSLLLDVQEKKRLPAIVKDVTFFVSEVYGIVEAYEAITKE